MRQNITMIHYHDIGDYLDREQKLKIIAGAGGLQGIEWEIIIPNEKHDWLNQRGGEFDTFISLGDKKSKDTETIFDMFSLGVVTNRDSWCWNFSQEIVRKYMTRMIVFYNKQRESFHEQKQWDRDITVDGFIDTDQKKISWTRSLKRSLSNNNKFQFSDESRFVGMYRPFCKQHFYFNRDFNECVYQMPQVFPEPGMENMVICTDSAPTNDFSTIITNTLVDLVVFGAGHPTQCFPLYTYERVEPLSGKLFNEGSKKYVRKENISNAILTKFREKYAPFSLQKSQPLTKEDIFYYVYGILYSPCYKTRFASDLKKQLPRIPMVDDFWAFSKAGRRLAELHLNYESGEMYPVEETIARSDSKSLYHVTKMRFPSKTDKSSIIYNDSLTLAGIPAEAYRYVVNGRSAIEWIMERYQISTHKDSGIVNDPNDWCKEQGNDRYIVDLIKRVVYLSVESVKIIEGLPKVEF